MERSLSHSFFSEELRLQMWKASNKLIWGSIFFLIFISILDFLLIKDLYVTLTMLNLAALALIVLCNYTLTKIQQKPMWLLHMVFIILVFLYRKRKTKMIKTICRSHIGFCCILVNV